MWTSDENYDMLKNFIKTDKDHKLQYHVNNTPRIKSQIISETDGKIVDWHLGEYGHVHMSNLIYKHIIKNERNV